MMGPKKVATRAVPRACTTNRPIRMTIVSGTTTLSSVGATSFNPSTAESTEIAGVRIASP